MKKTHLDLYPEQSAAFQVLWGTQVVAQYHTPAVSMYRENPAIEALTPMLSRADATTALARYPEYHENERFLPPHERLLAIQSALQFFEPLPQVVELYSRIFTSIWNGYLSRNPLDCGFFTGIADKVQELRPSTARPMRYRATGGGFFICGASGCGKSLAFEEILMSTPQVIVHTCYKGQPVHLVQIAWLKLDCPHDGSLRGLCHAFFNAVDHILGTRYTKFHGGARRTEDDMLPNMGRVAATHAIGVLVIDEIQVLRNAAFHGTRMMDFFVRLHNTIGVPVVLVGTYAAGKVLSQQFRQVRRGIGQGSPTWDRLHEGPLWDKFLMHLSRYQYLHKPVSLDGELSATMYDVTQGIVDFVVKIFMLAQTRAIAVAAADKTKETVEELTPDLLRSVARDALEPALPLLDILRVEGNAGLEDMHNAEDLYKPDWPKHFSVISREMVDSGPAEGPIHVSGSASAPNHPLSETAAGEAPKQRTRRKKSSAAKTGTLMSATAGVPCGSSLQALEAAGVMRPTTTDFDPVAK